MFALINLVISQDILTIVIEGHLCLRLYIIIISYYYYFPVKVPCNQDSKAFFFIKKNIYIQCVCSHGALLISHGKAAK